MERYGESMKNPNGYGSVTKLSGKRRKPFWVKKTEGWNEKGHPIYTTIGYAATREEGNIMLAEYNKNPWNVDRVTVSVQEMFDLWKEKKAPKLGESNRSSLISAFKHCKKYAGMKYIDVRSYHMQDCIDNCGKGYSTQASIKNLWRHLDRFALELDMVTRMYSDLLTSETIPETSREPFTNDEIKKVWKMWEDFNAGKVFPEEAHADYADTILMFIYSGFRITELCEMKTENIDLDQQTFKGGVKTAAGKNRIVPIHSAILPMVKDRVLKGNEYLLTDAKGKKLNKNTYRSLYWKPIMKYLGMDHTPHECRHTFESVLDSKGANRKCIDLLMGHASKDVGNRVYNHKTLEELKEAIELFKVN